MHMHAAEVAGSVIETDAVRAAETARYDEDPDGRGYQAQLPHWQPCRDGGIPWASASLHHAHFGRPALTHAQVASSTPSSAAMRVLSVLLKLVISGELRHCSRGGLTVTVTSRSGLPADAFAGWTSDALR